MHGKVLKSQKKCSLFAYRGQGTIFLKKANRESRTIFQFFGTTFGRSGSGRDPIGIQSGSSRDPVGIQSGPSRDPVRTQSGPSAVRNQPKSQKTAFLQGFGTFWGDFICHFPFPGTSRAPTPPPLEPKRYQTF